MVPKVRVFCGEICELDSINFLTKTMVFHRSSGACMDCPIDSYPVSLSTGLKDKHGKEIYEGDVVKYQDFRPQVIVWEPSEAGMFIGTLTPGTLDVHGDVEIIGNRWENPELLTR